MKINDFMTKFLNQFEPYLFYKKLYLIFKVLSRLLNPFTIVDLTILILFKYLKVLECLIIFTSYIVYIFIYHK